MRQWPDGCTRPLAMGVLNLTPDSFHDGGRYIEEYKALEQVLRLAYQGADIIDIGAASSRPGYTPLSWEEEAGRLLPLLSRLSREKLPSRLPLLSVDTDNSQVAAAALSAGAAMLNDTSGRLDSPCFELAAAARVPLCIMFRAGAAAEAEAESVLRAVEGFFRSGVERAARAGLPRHLLILDPGLGFNQTPRQSLDLIEALPRLNRLGQPLLIGYSHKRCSAALSGEAPGLAPLGNARLARRVTGLGAAIVRVHEIDAFFRAIAHDNVKSL